MPHMNCVVDAYAITYAVPKINIYGLFGVGNYRGGYEHRRNIEPYKFNVIDACSQPVRDLVAANLWCLWLARRGQGRGQGRGIFCRGQCWECTTNQADQHRE